MKKLIAMLLALVMMLCIVACAPAETPNDDDTPGSSSSTPSSSAGDKDNVSGVMTHAQYLAAEADAAVEVECYVQATQSWWDDKIVVYAMDKSYGGYFAYNLTCSEEDAAKLVPGTKINIKGYKTYYKGMPEIAEGATFTIVEGADTFIASAEILTEKLGKQELVNHAGQYAAFQGLTVAAISYKNDAPGDDIYVDFTLGDATYSFCVERYLTDPESDVYKAFVDGDVQVGDVVDVYGFVYWYDADEDASGDGINTHITKITKAK